MLKKLKKTGPKAAKPVKKLSAKEFHGLNIKEQIQYIVKRGSSALSDQSITYYALLHIPSGYILERFFNDSEDECEHSTITLAFSTHEAAEKFLNKVKQPMHLKMSNSDKDDNFLGLTHSVDDNSLRHAMNKSQVKVDSLFFYEEVDKVWGTLTEQSPEEKMANPPQIVYCIPFDWAEVNTPQGYSIEIADYLEEKLKKSCIFDEGLVIPVEEIEIIELEGKFDCLPPANAEINVTKAIEFYSKLINRKELTLAKDFLGLFNTN